MATQRSMLFIGLCIAPFVVFTTAAARSLRVNGVYQAIGLVLCLTIVAASWALGLRAIRSTSHAAQRVALAGGLLLVPFTLIALLWVGIGTPLDATPQENVLRYFVLLTNATAITSGFVVLQRALVDAGESVLSPLGVALATLAGTGYFVWTAFMAGYWVLQTSDVPAATALTPLVKAFDALDVANCSLTYATTAAFVAALYRVGWLGRVPAYSYVVISLAAFVLIWIGGVSPDLSSSSTPWYLNAGFIAGIPAIPWIMPFLLGLTLLRRVGAGD